MLNNIVDILDIKIDHRNDGLIQLTLPYSLSTFLHKLAFFRLYLLQECCPNKTLTKIASNLLGLTLLLFI